MIITKNPTTAMNWSRV